MSEDLTDPIDRHVGAKIRQRRKTLGLSQQALADQLGVSFQQVQKYERGANRVAGSTLLRAAQALGVRVGDLFDGLEDGALNPQAGPEKDFFAADGALQLAENFLALSKKARKLVVSTTRDLRDVTQAVS